MRRLTVMFRSPLIVGIVLAGVLATFVAATATRRSADARTSQWLSERAEIVREEIESTVSVLTAGVEAVRAFMEVNPGVDQEEFSEFVGRLDQNLSLIGLAYVRVVPAQDLPAYERTMRDARPDFEVIEVTSMGEQQDALGRRSTYYPVELFQPGTLLSGAMAEGENPLLLGIGVDGGSVPEWETGLSRAVGEDTTLVSDFITLGTSERVIGQAFVIAVPVHADGPESNVRGLLAAPLIDRLLPTEMDVSITDDVTWEVAGTDGGFPLAADGLTWDGHVEVTGGRWQLRVQPTEDGLAGLAGTPMWVVFAAGLAATLILAALAELFLLRLRSKARVAELQRLSDDKDRFLASVSHELRTPLTAVSGLARELRDRPTDFDQDELHQLLVMVAEQADEVAAIVEDLLVAARSDIGKVTVHHAAVDLGEQVRAALDGSAVGADVIGRPTTLAYADAQRVRQILRNLLTNAARYGGEKVQVRFETTATTVSVEVADSGEPIPNDQVVRIFDPYTTAEEKNNVVGSIGLGLHISRTLAGLMDGSLAYAHDGNWSVFTLCLPSVEAVHLLPQPAV